jgi:hypothetical protein
MNAVSKRIERGFRALRAVGLHALPLDREGDSPPRRGETQAHLEIADFGLWLKRSRVTRSERAALEAQWEHRGVSASLGNNAYRQIAEWLSTTYPHLSDEPWTAGIVKKTLESADKKLRRAM